MSVKKNLLYNISYQLLIMFLPLITTPYISRVIGAEGIGIYSYTYSIANYFALFAMLGLTNYGNRSIATVRHDKDQVSEVFFSIYGLQLITSITMVILYILYVVFFISEYQIIYWIQLVFLISTILDINWFFFGLEQFKITVIRNIVIKLSTVVSIFIFVKEPDDLATYTLIMALGIFISQCMLWFLVRKYVVWSRPTLSNILNHIKPNLTLFIPVLAISIYKIMDKIMLGFMTSTVEVGYYENSEKIISVPLGVVAALGIVMIPRMSNLISIGNENTAVKYVENSMKFVMFISIGATVGLIGIAPKFIPLFLGHQFTECIDVVSLLSITILFISWANVIRTQFLIPRKKDKIYIYSTLVGAAVNVGANLIFIPMYGALGAAIGTIFAEAIVAIYQTIKVRNELNVKLYLLSSSIYIMPAIGMYYTILYFSNTFTSPLITTMIQILIGGGVYIVLSLFALILADKSVRKVIKSRRFLLNV